MAKEKKTLLAVLAHPDDESFGMGGTLAHYARQGVAVYLVCASDTFMRAYPPPQQGVIEKDLFADL